MCLYDKAQSITNKLPQRLLYLFLNKTKTELLPNNNKNKKNNTSLIRVFEESNCY